MSILLMLITALQAASTVAFLFTVFKPDVSERTRQTAFNVLIAVTLLAAVAYLISGDTFHGTLFAAYTVAYLAVNGQVIWSLARWVQARRDRKSTK